MKVTGHWPWRWLYSLLREQLGKTLNVAGFPGFVRECDYESKSLDVSVRVRVSPLFTIITVRGVDVYFYRGTGKIDGVGYAVNPNVDCRQESIQLSNRLAEPPEIPLATPHN